MTVTFEKVRDFVGRDDWRVVVEDYLEYHAGPCVLLLQCDRSGPVHALRGLEKNTERPAVLVTAYRPSRARWREEYRHAYDH